jgi:hypothetical protein
MRRDAHTFSLFLIFRLVTTEDTPWKDGIWLEDLEI